MVGWRMVDGLGERVGDGWWVGGLLSGCVDGLVDGWVD